MPTKSSRLSFRRTFIAEALSAGIEDLAADNYAEVEVLTDILPLDVSWAGYQLAERIGEFRGYGAFCKGDLVGYAGYFVRCLAQNQRVLAAQNASLYMAPEHRGWGSRDLRTFAYADLKAAGVRLVLQSVKEPNSTGNKRCDSLCRLLAREGYKPYERILAKVLE